MRTSSFLISYIASFRNENSVFDQLLLDQEEKERKTFQNIAPGFALLTVYEDK